MARIVNTFKRRYAMTGRRPWRRALTRIACGVLALIALLIALAVPAPLLIRDARFGKVVGWMMPSTRGSITVAGGRWSWAAVWELLHGRPAPIALDGVRIVDPEGTEVLRAAHVTVAIEVGRDPSRLVLHDLHVSDGLWRFASLRGERAVGLLAAVQSSRPAAARPRPAARASSFAIRGAVLDGIDTTFDLPGWGLAVARVHAHGNLALASGPGGGPGSAATARPASSFTFDVSDADLGGGGVLRILGGAARVELPFSAGRIARIATTTDAPDALELHASGVATGSSRLDVHGAFLGLYGVSRPRQPPGIDLHAHLEHAADALGAILARHTPALPVTVGKTDADLQLGFLGPFDRLKITAAARGFDLRLRDLDFRGVGFDAAVEPAAARARVSALTFASPSGGRFTLDAELDRRLVRGALALDRFSTAPYLPTFLRPLAGGVLDGRVRGAIDLAGRTGSLDELTLTLARPAGTGGPRRLQLTTTRARGARSTETLRITGARYAGGTLTLPALSGAFAGGEVRARARITLADAAGHLRPPVIDVDAQARRISLTELVGPSFASGTLSFRARARGALDALELTVDVPADQRVRVFGELCHLPPSTVVRMGEGGIAVADFQLRGEGGTEIGLTGRIGRAGQLALTLDVRAFPLGMLPAVAEAALPFSGQLSGQLRATGSVRAPELAGEMTIDRATFQGRSIGGGRLVVTPRPGGAIHGVGQVIEGVSVEGTLAPQESGPRGVATMQLRSLRLDPFLSMLPGGITLAGVVSGTFEARVAPGTPSTAEGRLTELGLTLTSAVPGARRPGAPPRVHTIELHAISDVRMSARAGGPIRVEPARFAGSAGSVELWGESDQGGAQAGVRGRLALGAVAPLVLPWLSHLSGDLDFDIAAKTTSPAIAASNAVPVVTGTVRVGSPIAFRAAGLPFDARVNSGEIRLDDNGVARLDLPVTLGTGVLRLAGTVTEPAFTGEERRIALALDGELDAHLLALAAPRLIATARGTARLDGRAEGTAARPAIRARLRPGHIVVTLRALPVVPISVSGGQIDVGDHAATVSGLVVAAGVGAHAGVVAGGVAGGVAGVEAIIGAPADGAAELSYGSLMDPRPARIVLPVRGRVTATPIPPVVIDDARFALRADGDLTRRTRVSGEIALEKAHVPRALSKAAAGAPSPASSSPTASRPELARVDLDLTARSRGGAVTVEIPHLPNAHVDVDYHITGTAAKPKVAGKFEGANIYSSFLLLLRRIFQ